MKRLLTIIIMIVMIFLTIQSAIGVSWDTVYSTDFSSDDFTDIGNKVYVNTTQTVMKAFFDRIGLTDHYSYKSLSITGNYINFEFDLHTNNTNAGYGSVCLSEVFGDMDATWFAAIDAYCFASYGPSGQVYRFKNVYNNSVGADFNLVADTNYVVKMTNENDVNVLNTSVYDSTGTSIVHTESFVIGGNNLSTLDYVVFSNLDSNTAGGPFLNTYDNLLIQKQGLGNFTLTCLDLWTGNTINSFNAYIDGVGWFNTTSGTEVTTLLRNDTSLYNITIYPVSGQYLYREYLNTNISTTLTAELYPYNSVEINLKQTNGTLIKEEINLTFIDELTSWENTTSTGSIGADLLSPVEHELRITTANYVDRNVFFTVTENSTQTLNVYLLTDDNNTEIQNFRVLDTTNTEVSGATLWIQKEVLTSEGNFLTTDQKKTDSEGETSAYINKGINEYYRFAVSINNTFKPIYPSGETYTEKTFFISGDDTTADIIINLEESSGSIEETYSVTTSLTFDNNTDTLTYTYADASQSITGARIDVYARYLEENLTFMFISDNSSSETSGVLKESFVNTNNTEWEARGYITYNNHEVLTNTFSYRYDTDVVVNENLGLLIAIIIFIVVILITMRFGAVISVTSGLSSFWITKLFVFIDIQTSVIATLIVFGLLLFFKVSGKEK